MNLVKFLSKTDELMENMSKDKLQMFIRQLARRLPENNRDEFLTSLSHTKETENSLPGGTDSSGNLKEEADQILEELEIIDSAEKCIDSVLHEGYDDWYDDSDEFFFRDTEGILDEIIDAVHFVHRCIDEEQYKLGYKVGIALLELTVTDEGDFANYVGCDLDLSELSDREVISVDYRAFLIEVCYLAYQTHSDEEKAESVFYLLSNYGQFIKITLEMVLQYGENLTGIDAFLSSMILYLGAKSGKMELSVLNEALELADNPEILLETAKKNYDTHPSLYLRYIERVYGKVDAKALLNIGNEALEKINQNYLVRSKIALILAKIAMENGNHKDAENYWLEAFRSDSSFVNYLRLTTEAENPEQYEEELRSILSDAKERLNRKKEESNSYSYSCYSYRNEELMENDHGQGTIDRIEFFLNGFSEQFPAGMETEVMVNITLLLLYPLEEGVLQEGLKQLLYWTAFSLTFKDSEYIEGTVHQLSDNPGEEEHNYWFKRCFLLWKKRHAIVFSKAEQEKYLRRIQKYAAETTERVIKNKNRNRYYECACYIAAIGEVSESLGIQSKQSLMQTYKESYPRYRAFRQELKKCGML